MANFSATNDRTGLNDRPHFNSDWFWEDESSNACDARRNSPWETGEPNNNGCSGFFCTDEDCVRIRSNDLLSDKECGSSIRPLCAIDVPQPVPSPSPTPTPSPTRTPSPTPSKTPSPSPSPDHLNADPYFALQSPHAVQCGPVIYLDYELALIEGQGPWNLTRDTADGSLPLYMELMVSNTTSGWQTWSHSVVWQGTAAQTRSHHLQTSAVQALLGSQLSFAVRASGSTLAIVSGNATAMIEPAEGYEFWRSVDASGEALEATGPMIVVTSMQETLSSSPRNECTTATWELSRQSAAPSPLVGDPLVLGDLDVLTLQLQLGIPPAIGAKPTLQVECSTFSEGSRFRGAKVEVLPDSQSAEVRLTPLHEYGRFPLKRPFELVCNVAGFESSGEVVTVSYPVVRLGREWPLVGGVAVDWSLSPSEALANTTTSRRLELDGPVSTSRALALAAVSYQLSNSAEIAASPQGSLFLTLSGETVITLMSGRVSYGLLDAVSVDPGPVSNAMERWSGFGFTEHTRVWIGGAQATVFEVDEAGMWLRCITPKFHQICSSIAGCAGRKGYQALTVVNPDPEAVAIEGSDFSTSTAKVFMNATGGVALSCPPHCPGVTLGRVSAAEFPSAYPTSKNTPFLFQTLPSKEYSFMGVYYTPECQGYLKGAICLDPADADRCGYGLADQCRACPKGGFCPGGWRIFAQPGWWLPPAAADGESFFTPVQCKPPALERCVGYRGGRLPAECGEPFAGFMCGGCASGYYTTLDGSCIKCTAEDVDWSGFLKRVGYIAAVLLGFGLLLFGLVVWLLKSRGGTLYGGMMRAVNFIIWSVLLLQVCANTISAASLPLHPFLFRFRLSVKSAEQ